MSSAYKSTKLHISPKRTPKHVFTIQVIG
uniref:Uncharacterized protein n=1 Tax=Lepeophtheirus salmonis TaxID=72036 RepID=A0A0K2TPB9_LEPSM